MSDLTRFKNIHLGEVCVIIGNGPSLNVTPLKELGNNYLTLGSNKIYRYPYTPNYYSVIDKEMLATCLPLPKDFVPDEMFLRAEYGLDGNNPIYPIVAAGFSLDINNFIVMGGTVTYALLQIAYFMGFQTVLLVGVDHHYPKTSNYGNHKFTADKYDPDHFKPSDGKPYFDEGKIYNPPELSGTTLSYGIASELFKKSGREIINLTPWTKLDVFPKDEFKNWL